jgi:GNAT superfamily N-acetyltransferase
MTQPRTPASHIVVPAGPEDIQTLSHLIAAAFAPLDVCKWLIPDQDARHAILPAYFRMYVEHAFAEGLVFTTLARSGAALWLPSSGPGEPGDGYAEQLAEITGPWVDRFQVFDAELDAHHPVGVEHHHLAILGVAPDRQGQGIGTALLDAHHSSLDRLGIPAYLEAASERTRRIYLKHGYTDYGGPIVLPGGLLVERDGASTEPPPAEFMYPMLREPPRDAM